MNLRSFFGNMLKSTKVKRHALVGDGKLWKVQREFQIKFLKSNGLKDTDKLLEVGCGTMRGGIPIIDYLNSGNYYGIDVRDNVLVEGKKELKESGLEYKQPTLMHFTTFKELTIDQTFEVVWSFCVLFHMTDDIVDACFEFVSKHLAAEGVFFANVNIGSFQEGRWIDFPVIFKDFEFYNNLAKKYDLKVEKLGNLISLGHDIGKNSDHQQQMLKITRLNTPLD